MKTMESDPHKFLGSILTFRNSAADQFKYLNKLLLEKLENLDSKCAVRGEYKLATYTRYLLPSLRFHLSVHSIHKTHLDKLDHTAKIFLKKWLGFPSHGVTDLSIFHPYLLGVKPVSQVYMEGHMASYINSTILADSTVVDALKCAVEREEAWVKKSSTIVKCKQIFAEVGENIVLNENISSRRRAVKDIKKAANKHIAQEYLDKANQHANEMVVQGEFTVILAEEEKDVAWKSIIYQVPRGVMAFSL